MTASTSQAYTVATLAGDLAPIAVNFPVYATSDLRIEIRDADTNEFIQLATAPAHCTIALAQEPSVGATITPTDADVFADGRKAWVIRQTPIQQVDKFSELEKFPGRPVEQNKDRQTAMMQDLARDLARAPKMRPGENGPEFPDPEDNTVLGWVSGVLRNVALATVSGVAVATSWLGVLGAPLGVGWAIPLSTPFAQLFREQLNANLTLYVDHASGSNSNSGRAADAAFATVTYAFQYVRDRIDLNGYQLVIKVADGTWSEVVICSGVPMGYRDLNSIIIRGNLDSEAACFNEHLGDFPCFSIYENTFVRVEGIKFSNPNALDHGFKVYRGAYVEIAQMVAGDCAHSAFQCADGWITVSARGDAQAWTKWDGAMKIGIVVEVGNGGFDETNAQRRFGAATSFLGHPKSAYVNVGEGAYYGNYETTSDGGFTGRKYYISDQANGLPQDRLEEIPGSEEGVWCTYALSAPQGRLTAEAGVAVPSSEQLAKTSLHYVPYIGDYGCFAAGAGPVYEMATIGQAGLVLHLSVEEHLAGTNYDGVLFRRAGDGKFLLGSLPAWASSSARTADISRPNGILANTDAATVYYDDGDVSGTQILQPGEGVYVGTFRCSANGEIEDSFGKGLVWNMYNRVRRLKRRRESTSNWDYSSSDWRQVRGDSANQIELVIGFSEDVVHVQASAEVANSTSTGRECRVGIGVDSTSAPSGGALPGAVIATNAGYVTMVTLANLLFAAGDHKIVWLEKGAGTDTQNWRGNAGVPFTSQTGIQAEFKS